MAKDYYERLGVPKNAAAADIKKAYRRLARKYHPDLNPGDKTAEAKFKEIQEAYAVLNDPKKKAQYDQFGFAGEAQPGAAAGGRNTGGFDGFDFSSGPGNATFRDFFDNIFGAQEGGEAGQGPAAPGRGEDLHYNMALGFGDAVNGVETRIRVNRLTACVSCGGAGTAQGSGRRTCPDCGGKGRSSMQRGFMKFSGVCPTCKGSGSVRGQSCSACGGGGRVQNSEMIAVRIPAGVDSGSKVRIPGKGNAGMNGGPAGDLYISIEVAPHALFKRDGSNIMIKVPVTVPEATLGAKISVPTLSGKTIIRIPPGTRSGQKFRIKGEGVQSVGRKVKGDQVVEVYLVPPPFDDQRVRELMKELETLSGPNPRENLGS